MLSSTWLLQSNVAGTRRSSFGSGNGSEHTCRSERRFCHLRYAQGLALCRVSGRVALPGAPGRGCRRSAARQRQQLRVGRRWTRSAGCVVDLQGGVGDGVVVGQPPARCRGGVRGSRVPASTSTCADSAVCPEVICQTCRSCTRPPGAYPQPRAEASRGRRRWARLPGRSGRRRAPARCRPHHEHEPPPGGDRIRPGKPVSSTTTPATAVAMKPYRSVRMCCEGASTFRLARLALLIAPRDDVDHDSDQGGDQHSPPGPAPGRSVGGSPRRSAR